MSQTVDYAAAIRNSMALAYASEPDDVNQRARAFVVSLAGAVLPGDPHLAAEVFVLLTNHQRGKTVMVVGSGQ